MQRTRRLALGALALASIATPIAPGPVEAQQQFLRLRATEDIDNYHY